MAEPDIRHLHLHLHRRRHAVQHDDLVAPVKLVRRAAARGATLERIEAMPDGFDTMVGERGMKLSGGERQRIAIARTLYEEPSILILDEASSALDADTEAEIMDGLRSLAGSLTILSVTHRTSIIRPGDQVFHLPGQKAQSNTATL